MTSAPLLRRVSALSAENAALKTQVAHFQAEYQDSVSRTEAIENVEKLKIEIAALKADRETLADRLKLADDQLALANEHIAAQAAESDRLEAEATRLRKALEEAADLAQSLAKGQAIEISGQQIALGSMCRDPVLAQSATATAIAMVLRARAALSTEEGGG